MKRFTFLFCVACVLTIGLGILGWATEAESTNASISTIASSHAGAANLSTIVVAQRSPC